MNTNTLEIRLSDDLRDFAEEQTARGGFDSVSAYVQALLEEERKRKAERRLEDQLLAGLSSGPAVPVTPEFWARLRRRQPPPSQEGGQT